MENLNQFEGGCGCAATTLSGGGMKRLECLTKKELYDRAKEYKVEGRSKMNKEQLITAIRQAHKRVGENIRKRSRNKS
jgi:hypothetical protein